MKSSMQTLIDSANVGTLHVTGDLLSRNTSPANMSALSSPRQLPYCTSFHTPTLERAKNQQLRRRNILDDDTESRLGSRKMGLRQSIRRERHVCSVGDMGKVRATRTDFSATSVSSSPFRESSAAPVATHVPGELSADFMHFQEASGRGNLVPMFRRIFSDHLTPVLAYRCLVPEADRDAPSFLFESVEHGAAGSRAGRFSYVGAQPALEVVAKENVVNVMDHLKGTRSHELADDPMTIPVEIAKKWKPVMVEGLPPCFCGGWVGFTGYDTMRYVEKKMLPFENAPDDDRDIPDLHLSLYNDVIVFDHVQKVVYVVCWMHLDSFPSVEEAHRSGNKRLRTLVQRLLASVSPRLAPAFVDLALDQPSPGWKDSNMSKEQFCAAVEEAKEHILAGDIFQVVLSQRFERRTFADPFEIYRALRIVNPSPYLTYLQARGCILVASSPEILCRVTNERSVVNRPLAGTRKRGASVEEDLQLERELLADEKECAEHTMLVDLGRNDVGKVSKPGRVKVERFKEVERYSHVMHISSTVVGDLKDELSCWDALRAALPVGTVSGAPKVRAMQLIDELEPSRRGPYGGGMGYISFSGEMDIALALRTMVFPRMVQGMDSLYSYNEEEGGEGANRHRREWVVHLQAGAGVVADSVPKDEFAETVNKAAAMARAIDLAESAFYPVQRKE
eukprot:TRINITY_DN29464_c0_g1_i1.p1 TRINITY_DN29464_c0_g1~~TRINITY_DN29464_c0_g1_i1.p1  ORF type:complete len:678 (-),score=103.74 TRINITY_DN29464_c0_g1_i1:1033-3066(-)